MISDHNNADERLCIVIPVYNEQAAIGNVLRKWNSALSSLGIDYCIRAYNDGSKDNTLSVMLEVAKSEESGRIKVCDKPNGGHGNTILTGYRDAAEAGYDWVFQVDSDDEMGPESFAELWERRVDYDFLVGTRDGRVQALPRRIISLISRLCVRVFYGKGIWDVNTPYRLMRVSAFKDFFNEIPLSTFAPNVILSGLAARHGLRYFETPVPQHDRTTGEVSIRKWKLLKAAIRSFWQTVWFAKPVVPFLAFLPFALTLAVLNSTTFMWYDELAMCDGVFMKALHGLSWSGVWACSYNPLYPMCLVAWVKLFGASHFSVCSFTVVLGYVATLVIASIAHRRKWWRGPLADCAFVLLFWGGWHFSWILSNARVDVLVLLLSALFADALAGREGDSTRLLSVFTCAVFLFLAAPYDLPLMFFFGVLLLWTMRGRRVALVKRGFVAALGFCVAFAITAIYYFVQRDIIRLLGSYVYFNSITGYVFVPFWKRVMGGYLFDFSAIAAILLAFVFGAFSKRVRPYAIFVALIPALMVIGGRYESYYAWIFYVPAIVLLVSVANGKHRYLLALLAMIGGLSCVVHPVVAYFKTESSRANQKACRLFVERNASIFSEAADVVVAADLDGNTGFYYPLVEQGVRIWYRGPEMLTGRTDEEKFSEGLAFIPGDEDRKARAKAFIAKIQRFMPLLPKEALVMFYSEEEQNGILPLFKAKGKKLELLVADGGYSIWRMKKAEQQICK